MLSDNLVGSCRIKTCSLWLPIDNDGDSDEDAQDGKDGQDREPGLPVGLQQIMLRGHGSGHGRKVKLSSS
jgi:hypothetical protein